MGALAELGRLERAGDLPANLVLDTAALPPCANPATARALEELGATTTDVATVLSPAELGEMRTATPCPIDVSVEVLDDRGGFVRHDEAAEMIRAAAPLYVGLGARKAPSISPSGLPLDDLAPRLARERVRRVELVLRLLAARAPSLVEGRSVDRPADLGVPEP